MSIYHIKIIEDTTAEIIACATCTFSACHYLTKDKVCTNPGVPLGWEFRSDFCSWHITFKEQKIQDMDWVTDRLAKRRLKEKNKECGMAPLHQRHYKNKISAIWNGSAYQMEVDCWRDGLPIEKKITVIFYSDGKDGSAWKDNEGNELVDDPSNPLEIFYVKGYMPSDGPMADGDNYPL